MGRNNTRSQPLSVEEITVLCHLRKNNLMYVSTCKNDKHLVTLYNVIGNLSVWPNQHTNCYFLKNVGSRRVFGQNGIDITWNNDQKGKLVKQLMTQYCYSSDYLLLNIRLLVQLSEDLLIRLLLRKWHVL